MALLVFLRASAVQRLLIVATVFGGILLTALVLPRATLVRYATIFGGSDEVQMAENEEDAAAISRNASALESSASRKKLFFRSLELTLHNPILGVGPGVFQVAASALSHEKGERAMWLETHNTYTQVSSETGIPGAVLYLGMVIRCFRAMIKLRKASLKDPRLEEIRQLSQIMLLALTGFAVTSFFSSVAYKFMFPTVLGMAVSLARAGQLRLRAVAQLKTPTADPKPTSTSVRPRLPVRPAWQAMKIRPN
jgi:O-antigen ligase